MKLNQGQVLAGLVLLFFLQGCMTTVYGRFDESYVPQIQKGITTKQDVLQRLGKPHQTSVSPGSETWTYKQIRDTLNLLTTTKGAKGDRSVEQLLIIFFEDDVVFHYTFTKHGGP